VQVVWLLALACSCRPIICMPRYLELTGWTEVSRIQHHPHNCRCNNGCVFKEPSTHRHWTVIDHAKDKFSTRFVDHLPSIAVHDQVHCAAASSRLRPSEEIEVVGYLRYSLQLIMDKQRTFHIQCRVVYCLFLIVRYSGFKTTRRRRYYTELWRQWHRPITWMRTNLCYSTF